MTDIREQVPTQLEGIQRKAYDHKEKYNPADGECKDV
jgi:hypothetical protein